MKKYRTPNGNILDESTLRSKYGDRFDKFVADGRLILVDEEVSAPSKTTNGKYETPKGNLVDESNLREKYGNRFDEFVNKGLLKKKDGGDEDGTIAAAPAAPSVQSGSSDVPSNGQSSDESNIPAKDNVASSGLIVGAQGVKPNVYDSFLNNPDIGVNSIVEALQKEKADKRAAEYPEQKEDNDALIRSKVLAAMGEYDSKVIGIVKDNYLSGKLTADDVGVIVEHGNLVQDKGNINNQGLADKINERTKKLREQRTKVHGDPFDYKIQQRNLDSEIENTAKTLAKIKLGFGSLSDANELPQIEQKLGELVNKKEFLEYKWQQNVYAPAFIKRKNEIINHLEASPIGKDIAASDLQLKQYIDDYMISSPEPVLIAGNSGALKAGPFEIDDMTAASKKGDRYFEYTNKQGETAVFKNDHFTDLFNSVKQYFRFAKPAMELADKYTFGTTTEKTHSEIVDTEMGKMEVSVIDSPTGEFAKFYPIRTHEKQISNWFNEQNIKSVHAATEIQKEAIAESINQKYLNIVKLSPRFQEIYDVYQKKIESGSASEKDTITEFNKSLTTDPALKKYYDNAEKEVYAAFALADKKKLDFITTGLKRIHPSLGMTSNGISVLGASPEEFNKFSDAYNSNLQKAAIEVDAAHKTASNKAAEGDIARVANILPKEFMATLEMKARHGFNNLVASFADYFELPNLRNKAESAASSDIAQESDFAKSSEWNGVSSLLDPNFYASSMGQSLPYMAPAIVVGFLSGGTGAAAVINASLTGTLFETFENGLDTYHDMVLNGVKPNGEKVGIHEASRAMVNNMGNEIIPNLILSWVEFGALFRGAPKQLKRTIGREVSGAFAGLAEIGTAESFQEGLQGYFQQEARSDVQGKPSMNIWDYMQTEDFRHNFFGGLAGGIGFGSFKFGKRIVMAPATYNTWKGILDNARENYDLGSVSRGYALNEELNGTGAQFRDGLILRMMQNDYQNEQELSELKSSYQYSIKLKSYGEQLRLNNKNINGLAAVHHMIMADEYSASAKTVGEDTAAGKLYKEKAAASYEEAKRIYTGNAEGVFYVTNAATNTPIFLSQQDATALSENGDLQGLWNKGFISGLSDNLKIDNKKSQEPSRYSPEEVVRREAESGNLPSGYNDIIKANPGLARQLLVEMAGQKYGVTSDGKLTPIRKRPVLNKAVDDAITSIFPDRKSLITLIHQKKSAGLPTEAETAQHIGEAKNDDKGLFADLFKAAQKEYHFANLGSEEVVAAAYHKIQSVAPEVRTENQTKFINDVHKLLKTYQDAETVRINQRQAGEEGGAVRQGSKTGGNDLQRVTEEKAVNAETGQVKLPDHGVTVGEMIDRAGSFQGRKGKFIQRGDEVIFKDDGFGGLTHILGKYDDIANRPVDDFGIQAQESVIVNDNGVFTIRGEKFVNNFKDPLDAINKSKRGYAVTLENEKGQKRTFRGSIAEDIAAQIFYHEIKKEENGKELFEGFINSDPEAIQNIQDGGYSEAAPAGAVDATGDVLLEAKDEEIRSEEADLADKTEEDKVTAAQTAEEQKAEAIKNALKPSVQLVFAPENKLVGTAADRFGMIDEQNRVKEDFDKLNELIECCYG